MRHSFPSGADWRSSCATTPTEIDPNQISSSRVVFSHDDGLTWGSSTLVADGPTDGVAYQESNLRVLDNGEVNCMHLTGTNRRLYSISTDVGATWSKPVLLPLTHASGRPSTIQCTDSAKTMLHVYRPSNRPLQAGYMTSTDRGRTLGTGPAHPWCRHRDPRARWHLHLRADGRDGTGQRRRRLLGRDQHQDDRHHRRRVVSVSRPDHRVELNADRAGRG